MDTPMKKGVDYTGVCVVFFCHDGAGRFVMAKRKQTTRDEHGRWDIGGGGMEFDATIDETIRTEIREEYRTEVLEIVFLGYRDVHREHEGRKTHWIALDYKVRVDPTKVGNGEPHKFDAVDWFTLDALPSPTHSQFPHFLELYKDKLR